MPSVYATTVVRDVFPILIPVSHGKGFILKSSSNILNGQPCRTPHCMSIGHVVC